VVPSQATQAAVPAGPFDDPGGEGRGPSAHRFAARAVDAVLEASVVGSFSRIGYLVRRPLECWGDPPSAHGKVALVTGASSGIGRCVALSLGALGAQVWAVGRDEDRTKEVATAICSRGGTARAVLANMSDGESVSVLADRVGAATDRLDVLVHCAGSLLRTYQQSADGVEMTVATHVLGPYRLTWCLASLLHRARAATIVTVSSGGMYAERFDLARLEVGPHGYDGVRAYARAKRAQVVLAHEWARRWGDAGIASHAMHPGWVDTPGLAKGLPSFRLGPLLRRPHEGADTAVWLAAGGARDAWGGRSPRSALEGFWHDRRSRSEHRLFWTRAPLAPEAQGRALWDWCARRTGVGGDLEEVGGPRAGR